MKKLLFLFIASLLFVSCSTVHKNISSVKKTEDSVSVVTKDTSVISTQIKQNDNFTARGVDITLNFADSTKKTSDTVKWTPFYVKKNNSSSNNPIEDAIQDALTGIPFTGQLPSSISIHIDSLTNIDNTSVIKDSSKGSQITVSDVKTNTSFKDRIISKTGVGAGAYIIIGIVVLIIIIFCALKFGFKLL